MLLFLTEAPGLADETNGQQLNEKLLKKGDLTIYKLKPETKDGRGYKLIYVVDVPLEVFWKFKTDFDNNYLIDNKYINSHRVVSHHKNVVITENVYSKKPGVTFRWQTTTDSKNHRLEFKLLNPKESGQKYHYGQIQLEALGAKTKVTQIAFFDFFGVSIWVNYPFYGGMRDFLEYTAHWEQKIVIKLKANYIKATD
jgi:hypothetical protein